MPYNVQEQGGFGLDPPQNSTNLKFVRGGRRQTLVAQTFPNQPLPPLRHQQLDRPAASLLDISDLKAARRP